MEAEAWQFIESTHNDTILSQERGLALAQCDMAVSKVRCIRSTMPLHLGTQGRDRFPLIPRIECSSSIMLDMSWDPQSDEIWSGTPNVEMMLSTSVLAMDSEVIFASGKAQANLVKQSSAVSRKHEPL